eukprot:2177074-Prymnesium_polylepis.1
MLRSLRKGTRRQTRPQRAPRKRTSSAALQSWRRPSVASRLLSRRLVRLPFPPYDRPPLSASTAPAGAGFSLARPC